MPLPCGHARERRRLGEAASFAAHFWCCLLYEIRYILISSVHGILVGARPALLVCPLHAASIARSCAEHYAGRSGRAALVLAMVFDKTKWLSLSKGQSGLGPRHVDAYMSGACVCCKWRVRALVIWLRQCKARAWHEICGLLQIVRFPGWSHMARLSTQ